MTLREIGVATVAALALGCVHPAYNVGIMARTVTAGDCSEALHRAREVEGQVPGFPMQKQAHYYLYLGMAHFCLGRRDLAWYWLARVEVIRQRYPLVLNGEHFVNYQMVMDRLGNGPRVNIPMLLAAARRDMDRDARRYRNRLAREEAELEIQ